MKLHELIRNAFQERFRTVPRLFVAPGRINLIGEHVDYNNGLVLPTAIDRHLVFAIAPNGSGQCHCYAADLDQYASFGVDDAKPGHHWSNYLMGVVAGILSRGYDVEGFDCVFGGNIPQGAGLSSSAALTCGLGFALQQVCDLPLDRQAIALIAQESEHEFAGVNCGIMDQYACLFSERDHVLLLDCRTLTHQTVPLDLADHTLLLVNSRVTHQLASTAYNDRRKACEEGVAVIHREFPEVASLRDARLQHLDRVKDRLSKDTYLKCRYVISEIDRVIMAAKFLNKKDLRSFGALMFQTHLGLSREYEVSSPETDFLVENAREFEGILGARMMGGGFGGCTLNIIQNDKVQSFVEGTRAKYVATFKKEPDFYSVKPSEGVHELTVSEA